MSLFPNPIEDIATVKIEPLETADRTEPVYLRFIDSQGRLIYQENIFNPSETFIDEMSIFRNFRGGIYYLQLISGNSHKTLKFIKY